METNQTEWVTDEFGTRRFHHGSWSMTIFESAPEQVYIECADVPNSETWSVDIHEDGMAVFGEWQRGYDATGARVTIPWRIVEEICEIRRSQMLL